MDPGRYTISRYYKILIFGSLLMGHYCKAEGPAGIPDHDAVYMLEYGQSEFPESYMIENGTHAELPFSWYFFLIIRNREYFLLDTGACDRRRVREFRIRNYTDPVELLRRIGVAPEQIQEIFLTHRHFDHSGCLAKFPLARLYTNPGENLPQWVELIPANGHARVSNLFKVTFADQVVLFTGDECYFRKYCLSRTPLPEVSRYDRKANLKALERIRQESDRGVPVFTLHDPAQKREQERIAPGIYRIFSVY